MSFLLFLLFLLPFFFLWLRTLWASAVCCKRPMNRSTSSKQWFRISWRAHDRTDEPRAISNTCTSTGLLHAYIFTRFSLSSFPQSHRYYVCKRLRVNLTGLLWIFKLHMKINITSTLGSCVTDIFNCHLMPFEGIEQSHRKPLELSQLNAMSLRRACVFVQSARDQEIHGLLHLDVFLTGCLVNWNHNRFALSSFSVQRQLFELFVHPRTTSRCAAVKFSFSLEPFSAPGRWKRGEEKGVQENLNELVWFFSSGNRDMTKMFVLVPFAEFA